MAQSSVAVWSQVIPPKTKPRGSRPLTLISKPLYTRVLVSDQVRTLFTEPSLVGTRLYIVMTWPPPLASAVLVGTVIVYVV